MATIEEKVEFGLDGIDENRKVAIPLRDALYAYKVLGELITFFHQPDNYRTLDEVNAFFGNKNTGALHVLWEAYYRRLRDVWPSDVRQAFDDGKLDWNPFLDK